MRNCCENMDIIYHMSRNICRSCGYSDDDEELTGIEEWRERAEKAEARVTELEMAIKLLAPARNLIDKLIGSIESKEEEDVRLKARVEELVEALNQERKISSRLEEKLKQAIEQDYCHLCGRILDIGGDSEGGER